MKQLRKLLQRGGALATTVAVIFCSYLGLGLSWRDAALAAIVFGLGGYLLPRLLNAIWGRRLLVLWSLAFALDLGIKAFLIAIYQTKPDAVLILDAISNTNSEESLEFVAQYWHQIGSYAAIAAAFLTILLLLQRARGPSTRRLSRISTVWLALFAAAHLNPTFARSNPLVFWPQQLEQLDDFQERILAFGSKREIARAALPSWAPVYTGPQRQTIAAVIGESTNRWNWQLYGYARETTPELLREHDGLLVFRDVISGTSGTVSSFRMMMTRKAHDEPVDDEIEPSVVMLARAAGYKTFWISNQHDRYINPRFADEADVVHIINVGGGRGDKKLDEGVLPYWREALADPAPRKLIIVHLLGAHPHYEMRSPEAFKRFDDLDDAVSEELRAAGRSAWTRMQRDSYDNAMLYQDHVIASLLQSFKPAIAGSHGAFLFTSDHAQEVGHTRDFAGHSASEAGHTVPLLLWMSETPAGAKDWLDRPYQTDTLDWTLLDLLDIHTQRDHVGRSLISPDFVVVPRLIAGAPYIPGALAHEYARFNPASAAPADAGPETTAHPR